MRWNKIKTLFAGAVLVVSVATTGVVAQATTVNDGKSISYVGNTINRSNITNLKINGKAIKKAKKKIKVVKTKQSAQNNTYRTKSYFDTTAAYATNDAYQAENGSPASKYYPAESSYSLTFKKAGTYKISYVEYEKESYDYDSITYNSDYDHYDDASGKSIYTITRRNNLTDEKTVVATAELLYDDNDNIYYRTTTGTIYAYKDGYLVPSALVKQADGSMLLQYGQREYVISKKNLSTGNYDSIGSAVYVSNDAVEESYFQMTNGAIYADGDEGFVPATLARGADGKTHVRYTARKVQKVTHVTNYKVLKTNRIVKSVKLGKSTSKNSNTRKEGSYSNSSSSAKFLTGNSGKVTVSMADKNYGLNSILVETYDATGNELYAKVGNKKNVAFGQYTYRRESDPTAADSYYSITMYKPTTIIVCYKNKYTGAGTTVDAISADAEGNQTYVITNTYTGTNPGTNQPQTLTERYNVVRKKPYADAKGYNYYYTRTYQEWNAETKKYELQTRESYTDSLTDLLDYYSETTFYKK